MGIGASGVSVSARLAFARRADLRCCVGASGLQSNLAAGLHFALQLLAATAAQGIQLADKYPARRHPNCWLKCRVACRAVPQHASLVGIGILVKTGSVVIATEFSLSVVEQAYRP
jgi:hypothetical protein